MTMKYFISAYQQKCSIYIYDVVGVCVCVGVPLKSQGIDGKTFTQSPIISATLGVFLLLGEPQGTSSAIKSGLMNYYSALRSI